MDAFALPAAPTLRRTRLQRRVNGRGRGLGAALLVADAAVAAWLMAHAPAFRLPPLAVVTEAAPATAEAGASLPHFGRPFWRPPGRRP